MKLVIILLLFSLCKTVFAQVYAQENIGSFPAGGLGPIANDLGHSKLGAVSDILSNPYRQFGGQLFNLGYLVKWDHDETQRENSARIFHKQFYPTTRPMAAWQQHAGRIQQIIGAGLVFEQGRNTYCVTNFPGASPAMIGRSVEFWAQTVGTFRDKQQHGILLDYGVPVRVTNVVKQTNSVLAKSTNAVQVAKP